MEINKGLPTIRFGVMCNGTTFQKWQARCLENLLALDNVEISLLIIDEEAASQTIFDKIKKIRFKKFLFQLYMEFFIKPDAVSSVDMSKRLSNIPTLRCKTIKKGKFSQYFNKEDINTIQEYNLDFILRFGFGIIRGDILNVPRYGIWSYHHDDEEKYRGAPPCFWEIYNGDNITGAILQKLTDRLDAGIVLKKGLLRTINYSYEQNLNAIFLESSRWASQVCIDIRNGNADYLNIEPSQTNAKIYYAPTNFQMLIFAIKIFKNFFSMFYNTLFQQDQWNIGIVFEPIHTFLKPNIKPKIHFLSQPEKNKFLADPFGIMIGKKLTILYEDFDYRSFKGVISCIDIDDININKISQSQSKIIFEFPFHTSYPYIFEYLDEIYCIPETWQNKEIVLYKLQKPQKWIYVATLVSGVSGVDASVFQYDGLWWLTCTDVEYDECLNLFIWYSKDLFGPWKPHSSNPVKTNIRSSRPAGTPFMHDGNLYRPSQDCSDTYGGKIVINKVIKLTPTVFKEEEVSIVEPYGEYPNGVHTISMVGNITLIDGKRFRFIGSAFWKSLIQGMKYFLFKTRKNSHLIKKRKCDNESHS